MPQYHGDIMYQVGTIYESDDDTNYIVAAVILLFFGATGAHRFYMNDHRLGWMYLLPFAIASFVGFAVLDFTILLCEIGIAGIFLFAELVYFLFRIFR